MIFGGVLLAFVCWGFTFGVHAGNFWIKIGLSVLLVFSYSLIWQKPSFSRRSRSVVLGVLSAAVLYGIFFVGNLLAPYFVHEAPAQVGGIYGLGTGTDKVLVFLLLLLVTGPGEEIFWRGFLQSRMMAKWGNLTGYLVATAVYAAVHLFSGNFVLTCAALVAGAFWGALYLWRRDVLLLMVSHSLWSAVIFAVAPIR
jgi:membrane protease YdiL (CAAX protease family)